MWTDRTVTLTGCVGVIALCAFYWRTDLFLDALPGVLVLAVLHFCLFYLNITCYPQSPSPRRVRRVIIFLGALHGILMIILAFVQWFNELEDIEPGTFLAWIDILETPVVVGSTALLYWLFLHIPMHGRTRLALSATWFITEGSLMFYSWIKVYHAQNVPTLLPQTNTFFGQCVLVSMITTAVFIVAIAEATRLLHPPHSSWISIALIYLIVLTASCLDLASTACALAYWYIASEQKMKTFMDKKLV